MRQLKHHEQKLLKKTSLYDWKDSRNVLDNSLMHKYGVTNRQELITYRRTVSTIHKLVGKLLDLPPDNEVRIEITRKVAQKLYEMGVCDVPEASLEELKNTRASMFMARRLPCILFKLNMSQKMEDAVAFVKQGHVRVGPNVVVNPAFHVSRAHEDFVTWTRNSAIRRKIMKYSDTLDNFDLME